MSINSLSEPDYLSLDDGWWNSVLAEGEIADFRHAIQIKENRPNPLQLPIDWERAKLLFKDEGIITVTVIGFNRGGLLAEQDGLKGFIPCSHLLTLPIQVNDFDKDACFSDYVGKEIRVKIIECSQAEERLVFSERAATAVEGKRKEIFTTLITNQRLTGDVTNVTDFGVFVDLGGVEGLIHISELSWGRVAHPRQILQVGQKIEVLVLDVFPERCRIALSLKRLVANPWETAILNYPTGSIADATISTLVPFGAFARLEEGLEGLIHTSEIPLPQNTSLMSFLSPGQSVRVRILQIDASRQRLGLSMKLVQETRI